MDVTIIIINYNTRILTQNCLDSILNYTKELNFEIIVVDNNSKDGSIEQFKKDNRIKLIQNSENVGFGNASNGAAKIAKGKYLFFLNSDCIIIDNSIKVLYDFYESEGEKLDIGALGCYLLNEDKSITASYFRFPKISGLVKNELIRILARINRQNTLKDKTINYKNIRGNIQVECVSGASMMINKMVFEKFNGFDEDYFIYFEDTDLQKRLTIQGLKSYIIEAAKIVHLEGQSSLKNFPYIVTKTIFTKSMFLYFYKNHSFHKYVILKFLLFPLISRYFFINKYSFKDRKALMKTLLLD